MNTTGTCIGFKSLGIISTNCTGDVNTTCTIQQDRCVEQTRPWLLVLLVISSYLSLTVIFYEIRHWKRKQTAAVNRCYAASVVFTFLFAVSSVISIYRGTYSICLGHKFVSMFLYAASTLLIYTLLWMRQRLLHKGHLMGSATCNMDNRVSFCIIAGIYATFACLLIVFFGAVCLIVTESSCIVIYSTVSRDSYLKVAMIIFLCTGFIFRLGLLALMAHPLRKGSRNSTNPAAGSEIPRLLRRLFFSTAVCIVSSTFFAVSLFLDVYELACINWEVPGGYDMLASNVAIIFTFTDGLKRVFPFNSKSCHRSKQIEIQAP